MYIESKITDLYSDLPVRELGPTPFSKVSVFGGNASTHSSFTCGRKAKTDKNYTVSYKNACLDGA